MEELAELAIRYVGTRRRGKPLDPISLAEGLRQALDRYGSVKEVAKKSSVSIKQVQDFLKLLDLPPKVQKIIKEHKIGIDTARRLASRNFASEEQERLANAVVEHKLSRNEVREIGRFRAENPKLTIDECIRLMLSSRPVVERHYLVVAELKESARASLSERGIPCEKAIEEIIRKKISNPASLISLKIRGNLVFAKFQEDAYLRLKAGGKERGWDVGQQLEKLIEEGL